MKKILFFIPTLGGGGAEKVLVNLVNNLDSEKFDITVQTLFDYGINKPDLLKHIKYKYVFKKVFRGNIYLLKLFSPKFLFKKLINEKYDIIVSYLEGPTTRIISGCCNKDTKIINWVHTELKDIKEFTKTYRSMKEMKKCYEKYDNTVFVSKEAQEAFLNKVDLKKTKIIRNIIDIEDIEKKSKENDIDKFDGNCVNVITLGRLIQVKGYDRLLRIHKKIQDEGIKHKLYILGEGKERTKLENYIQNNNIDDSTYLLGYQSNPYKYINQADIYICSSYKEGYNTSIIEAIILEKPVITTRCSGMEEILNNGKYGIIVNNDEHQLYKELRNLIVDEKLRLKYKNLARERKDFFNMNNQLKKIYEIIN